MGIGIPIPVIGTTVLGGEAPTKAIMATTTTATITAAMAILKGALPDENFDSLFARLMKSADAPVEETGCRAKAHDHRQAAILWSSQATSDAGR